MPVLATPRLIAWLEAATVAAAAPHLKPGQTTVGISIRIDHTRPSAVGTLVRTIAEAHPHDSGRRISFSVNAVDDTGQTIGNGEIIRAIVDRDRFVSSIRA
nr:hotdog domain-containing protein [Flexivirga caeni]